LAAFAQAIDGRSAMLHKAWLFGGGAAATFAAFVACSNNPSNPPNGAGGDTCTYDVASALELASGTGSACASCIQKSCSPQVSAYESSVGCGGYLSCVCPGGTPATDAVANQACATQASAAGCAMATDNFNACIANDCATPCNSGNESGNGGSAGSGSGGGTVGGSAEGGALTPACQNFYTCCVSYYSAFAAVLIDAGVADDGGATYAATCQGLAEEYQAGASGESCASAEAAYAEAGVAKCP
jgi:hypothetical protein